jgi:hypothetical protein
VAKGTAAILGDWPGGNPPRDHRQARLTPEAIARTAVAWRVTDRPPRPSARRWKSICTPTASSSRALSPVLRVGDVVLTWGERVGPMHYRFRAVEPELSRIAEGQTVELAWPVGRLAAPAPRTPGALRLPSIAGLEKPAR